MDPILEVKHLTCTFWQQDGTESAAVRDVSFALYPNEILGIVGESGSGKSTLVKMIVRLREAAAGSILLGDRDITRLKGKELRAVYRRIQMVFQSPAGSFDPRRTLGYGIAESLRNNGISKKEADVRAERLLEQCGLSGEYARRYPHEVSGGQCQRAAIARALAVRPEILICDEATSALDVTVQKQIIELLRSLRQSTGMSYIFISHNLALVQQFCSRVLVMHEGQIVEEGTPDDIIQRPESEYARQLVQAAL